MKFLSESTHLIMMNANQYYQIAKPFRHVVIDNFLTEECAQLVAKEFPDISDPKLSVYSNAIEIKKLSNSWNSFGPETYSLMTYLNSKAFIDKLQVLTGIGALNADYGLHGGGQHMHGRGGKLNVHLDYSIHPKMKLERKLNLIIYLTPGWREEWGGELGLWSHDPAGNQPKELVSKVVPVFNRAVIFDTTQNSWHGLPDPIECPQEVTRNSLASYYLISPSDSAKERHKALFAPTEAQKNDGEVLELIAKRSDLKTAGTVYGDK